MADEHSGCSSCRANLRYTFSRTVTKKVMLLSCCYVLEWPACWPGMKLNCASDAQVEREVGCYIDVTTSGGFTRKLCLRAYTDANNHYCPPTNSEDDAKLEASLQ